MSEPKHRGPAKYLGVVCPFGCPEDTKIEEGCYTTTLIGGPGGARDPNHHKLPGTCTGCGKAFVKHWVPVDNAAWYTFFADPGRYVVLGRATCCQAMYRRPCEDDDCDGWMRHSTALSGAVGTSYSGGKPQQPMYWLCGKCDSKGPDDRYGWQYMGDSL